MTLSDASQKTVKWWQMIPTVIALAVLVYQLGYFVRDEQAVVDAANKNVEAIDKNAEAIQRLSNSVNKLFVITARHEVRLENIEVRENRREPLP